MKFNNLNLGTDKKSEFTKADVKSTEMKESKDQMNYVLDQPDPVRILGENVNASDKGRLVEAYNFKFVPREKLEFNPNNDFSMKDIDELAETLLLNGLLHNLVAYYEEDRDRYILESGGRRLKAMDQLWSKYNNEDDERLSENQQELYRQNIAPLFENGFPVNVKKAKHQDEDSEHQRLDTIDSELRKYTTNIDTRDYTAQERASYIQKIRKLMEERNRLLYGESAASPTQAELAAAVGTTERQLRKYNAIQNLIPALKAEFEAGNISINKVPGIAALPEEEQMIFLDLLQSGKKIEVDQIKLYKDQLEMNEREKSSVLEERNRLEAELERVKSQNEQRLRELQEEATKKEEYIRGEIERAEREKNENRIVKLQDELREEKQSSSRLYNQTNLELEQTKKALEEANSKLKGIEEKEKANDEVLSIRARMMSQLNMIEDLAEKFMNTYTEYQSLVTNTQEEKITLREKINNNQALIDVYTNFIK